MTNVKWNILKTSRGYQKNVEKLFEEVFTNPRFSYRKKTMFGWMPIDEMFEDSLPVSMAWGQEADLGFKTRGNPFQMEPDIFICENRTELIIDIRLPDLIRDSLYIEVRDNILSVKGKQYISDDREARDFGFSEIRLRSFHKFFPLPVRTRPDLISAGVKGDAIRIRIRKS